MKKAVKKTAPGRGFGKNKGFGGKPVADWEAQLLPPYRVYYKQGYSPPRFQGPLQSKVFEGEMLDIHMYHYAYVHSNRFLDQL